MTSGEFQELRLLFERLSELPANERGATIEELTSRDPALARELLRMLAAHDEPGSILDRAAPFPPDTGTDRAGTAPRSYVGAEIGQYRIERELGLGGMGMVYEAVRADGSFRKRVAIKILRPDRIDPLFAGRFQQERRILAQLDHQHIAAILDGGETPDGELYFVMEYVDGAPITKYCETRALTIEQRLDLFLQVCDAVQHAHRNLTVHRDLKPSNILVTPAGGVKLLDFGIAKLIDARLGLEAEAPTTAFILTPGYASPEQIRREAITTSADVFALGILLYELLSGEHPFQRKGRLQHEIMHAICEEAPPPPSACASRNAKRLRGDLDTIALVALRKDPAWRYPSVEQMADDIRRYRRGWPVLARGERISYRLRKFAARRWLPLTAAALLAISLTAGIASTAYQARRAERERVAAEAARVQAERERAVTERQRELAEHAQAVALSQQHLAEARTREAEAERQKEQRRYREVRSLASSMLFDLYDGIRDLAGSTTARRLIVEKARHQLELLSADGGNDLSLQRDLAASYERMGELRVDPHHPNKNDAAAAVESYQRGVDLRRKIAALAEAWPADRRDLALSLAKLGDGLFMAADAKRADESYQSAWTMAQALVRSQPGDESMRRALGLIDERRCIVLLAAGSNATAIEACGEGIALLSPMAARRPDDFEVTRVLATTEASYANALRLTSKPQDAIEHARRALTSLDRLELLAPNNAEYRRLASSAESILAATLAATGDLAGSLESFRRSIRSMQAAMEIDPSDLGGSLRLAVTMLGFSRRLAAKGDRQGAHDAARDALQLLEATSEKPGAGAVEWNEYADALLKAEFPDLQQYPKALELAEKAVSDTKRGNPFFLDTLAWAYFRLGQTSKAADTEREALRLLPADAKGGLHDELQRGLIAFLKAGS